MDALVSAALHEIAVEGIQGCSLPKLWAGLQAAAVAVEIDLDTRGRQMLWQQVLHVPGIAFLLQKSPGAQTLEAYHPSIQSVEDAEKLGVYVVAPEGLRESCLGLYDSKFCDASISRDQRELLERLAKARSQGVTQSQLGRDFKTGGNKMFYVVRSLEARGLVVRHATIVRTHQSAAKGPSNKFVPIVSTNLVHLTRYVKDRNIGSHMRFEIPSSSKSNLSNRPAPVSGDVATEEEDASKSTEEVLINDDHPAMARVCEKLEAADDKVLVVSDLKLSLNYRFAQGHRNWRRLAKRLQDAGLVEIFNAQIAGSKIVPCIRLLKPFDAKAFSPGNDEAETESQLRGVKRGQITDQVAETTLDRQIYDLIDSSGPAGLYMMDIWKQLGLNSKRNYFRVTNMLAKGCIVSEAEQHKRSMLYRLRTAFNASLASNCKSADGSVKTDQKSQNVVPLAKIAPPTIRRTRKVNGKEKEKEKEVDEETEVIQSAGNPVAEKAVGEGLVGPNESRAVVLLDMSSVKVDESEPFAGRSGKMYACPLPTTTAYQREIRIMQRLQEEKFIPRVELHRWIEESEKDRKGTMMDRKTLTRLLQKLQREGRVKCIMLSMPGLTNCGRSRTSEVVLLPEVEIGPELLTRVHDRIRQFDMIVRGYGSSKVKIDASSVPVLMGVKQMHKGAKRKPQPAVETEADRGRTLHTNGFIPAKMVRVRMLHNYLWSYVNGISEYADDELVMKADERNCRVFSLARAIKAMPLELFLQVIGSAKSLEELEAYCNKKLRLCDLPEAESEELLGLNASGRLSWLIDVLRRLKLIRLVMGFGTPLDRAKDGFSRTSHSSLEASLIYAMEAQPYIEEPAPQPLSSLSLDVFDLTPRARHEFTMTSNESLEAYWQTLEYFFSGALPTIARKAFPGSTVPELFGLRSWSSLRLMTLDQRKELMKRVEAGGEDKKMTTAECAAVAKELNLSLEQVLRVSYEKIQRYRLQHPEKDTDPSAGIFGNEVTFGKGHLIKQNIHAFSRKRAVTDAGIMEPAHVKAYKRQRQMAQGSTSEDPHTAAGLPETTVSSDREETIHEVNKEEGEDEEEEDNGLEGNPFNYLNAVTKLKPVRCRRFPWSEYLDRILICCYARQRAIMGAREHRVEWASMSSLPATPAACRRRICHLMSDPSLRKALLSLCSLLAARYLEQLDDAGKIGGEKMADVSKAPVSPSLNKDTDASLAHLESASREPGQEMAWDSFNEPSIAAALNEVIQLHNAAKALNSRRSAVFNMTGSKWPHQQSLGPGTEHPGSTASRSPCNMIKGSGNSTLGHSIPPASAVGTFTAIHPQAVPSPARCSQGAEPLHEAQMGQGGGPFNGRTVTENLGMSKSGRVRMQKRRAKPLSPDEIKCEEMVRRSLGVANAVELVKLVLLNSSSVSEVPAPVVDALRRCDESHVFAAFNFLREQELLVVGLDNQPFVLSPKFFHNAAASRFPFGTGNEALSTTQWLAEHDAALDQDWVPLPTDNFCGQLLQLLGVISEGTVTVAPFLPDGGVGESEDTQMVVVGAKRKTEGGQEFQFVKPKILRAEDSSLGFRRERGFPGIKVCLHRGVQSVGELLLAKVPEDPESVSEAQLANEGVDMDTVQDASSKGVAEPDRTRTTATDQTMDSEGDMSSELVECIHHFCSLSEEMSGAVEPEGPKLKPSLLRAAAHAIEEAGNEGLSIPQLTKHLTSTGLEVDAQLAEACVNSLESFDLVKHVNAYDHVRVIAVAHSGPFLLQITTKPPELGAAEAGLAEHDSLKGSPHSGEGSGGPDGRMGPSTVATLTSLATASRNWNGLQSQTPLPLLMGSTGHRRVVLSCQKDKDAEVAHTAPILPWLNGDGGVNSVMMKDLSRRVVGIVMLNPGIAEGHLVEQLDVLNPQTSRQLLETLESDGYLHVRKVLQPKPPAPPQLLSHLMEVGTREIAEPKVRRHYYADVSSGILL